MRKIYFNFSSPVVQIGIILCILILFGLIYSCSQQEETDAPDSTADIIRTHAFVGDQTCKSCHAREWEQWKGSHHDYAIGEADEEHVRGDFDDAELIDGEESYRFYREDGRFMVDFTNAAGSTDSFTISYTFGWEPLQQYLVDVGQGKYQALHAAWDTEQQRWYSLYPYETFPEDDWMHWRGGAMNWNNMCADCHSTNLQKNYIAEADSFHTTWSVLNVSCEACHGPGQEHVEFMNSPESENAARDRIRQDVDLGRFTPQIDEINTCAPCHSMRQKLTDDYIHGDFYLDHFDPQLPHPDNYFADGQILEEVFVYGSFLQSKMYTEGVQCTDCHNPHTLQLREPLTNNQLCMMCHEPEYNTPAHHFHEANTEGSACIDCHMTGRYYMGVDYRRDHSFRIPRPHQSVDFGTPNACNDCHTDRSAEWAANAIDEWYGEEREEHFTDVLLTANAEQRSDNIGLRELIEDETQPEIIRATAVWYAGRFPNEETTDILAYAIGSESPMVRNSAAKAMENLPADQRRPLLEPALEDSVRAVRIAASRNLAEFSPHEISQNHRDHFQDAMQEYRTYLDVNAYFPQGQMNRGQFYEQQGDLQQAMAAYETALERDPYFNPARVNLAYLHNRMGENERAEELLLTVIEQEPEFGEAFYSLGLLKAEQNRLEESVNWFEQAAELMPDHGRLFYNLAIAHQTLENPEEAEQAYQRAIEIDRQNGDFRYGLITLYMQQEQYERAFEQAEILNQMYPNNPQIQQLLQAIRQNM